jgi:hypothetical protein
MVTLLHNHPTQISVEWLRRLLCVATIAFSARMSGKRSVEAFRLILRGQPLQTILFPLITDELLGVSTDASNPHSPLVFLTVGVASYSS